jgi:serine/threonine-protein kinase RsbW
MEQIFQYPAEIHEIPRIRKDLEMLEKSWGISRSKMQQITVIVEELFSNIVRFAYEDSREHVVEVRMNLNENILHMVIIDDGIAFNPLEYGENPPNDPVRAESGGMGLTLVQTFASKMSYERKGDKNLLSIEKRI